MLLIDKIHEPVVGLNAESADGFAASLLDTVPVPRKQILVIPVNISNGRLLDDCTCAYFCHDAGNNAR